MGGKIPKLPGDARAAEKSGKTGGVLEASGFSLIFFPRKRETRERESVAEALPLRRIPRSGRITCWFIIRGIEWSEAKGEQPG